MSLTDYYELEWKKKCPQSMSFLASREEYSLCSHVMLLVFLPIYTFTTYCIIYKTPKAMSSAKVVLLISHACSCLLDIVVGSLITPYFFFPSLSGLSVGLMSTMGIPSGIQFYLAFLLVIDSDLDFPAMSYSLTALFENRSNSIPSNPFKFTKMRTRIVFYTINYLITILYPLPEMLNLPDEELAKLGVFKKIPCPSEYFFNEDVVITNKFAGESDGGIYLGISTFIAGVLNIGQDLFHFICCIYYLYFSTSHSLSDKTKKLQRRFFLGTLAQVLVPLFFLCGPSSCAGFAILTGYYNQSFNNLFIIMYSMHGVVTDIVIVLVHKPYRSFLFQLLSCAIWTAKADPRSRDISLVSKPINERQTMRKMTSSVRTML